MGKSKRGRGKIERRAPKGSTALAQDPPLFPHTLAPLLKLTQKSDAAICSMGELVAIRDMVFRMQDSVRPAFVPPPRRLGLFEERQRRFAALATVAGVAADKLHIGPVGNDDEDAELKGMGVTATAPIEGGELFVTVPESLMLSLHVGPAADTDFAGFLRTHGLFSQIPSNALALLLLREVQQATADAPQQQPPLPPPPPSSGAAAADAPPTPSDATDAASPFAAYIGMLPDTYTIPLFWTEAELELLEGTPAYQQARKGLLMALHHYHGTVLQLQRAPPSLDFDLEQLTMRDFFWAMGAAVTRQNQVPCGNGAQTLALVPIWDMCNHAPGAVTTCYDVDLKRLEATAMRAFAPGEPVEICYGRRPNLELLLYSGFALQDNPYNSTVVDLDQICMSRYPDDPLMRMKRMVIEKFGEALGFKNGFRVARAVAHASGDVQADLDGCSLGGPETFMACAHIYAAPREELGEWLRWIQSNRARWESARDEKQVQRPGLSLAQFGGASIARAEALLRDALSRGPLEKVEAKAAQLPASPHIDVIRRYVRAETALRGSVEQYTRQVAEADYARARGEEEEEEEDDAAAKRAASAEKPEATPSEECAS